MFFNILSLGFICCVPLPKFELLTELIYHIRLVLDLLTFTKAEDN